MPDRLLYIRDIGNLVGFKSVGNPIPRQDGKMHAHHLPGLGVYPIESALGEPSAVYDRAVKSGTAAVSV
ncbi:MAG: hypothetical protein OEO19_18690 [Gammaproteobacteria bacterium]|nr:hypothetical protein [Gammaproteobacteria bacterium]MDH3449021.1 hypothetical protein [Gammaproteobacteria bacterium]